MHCSLKQVQKLEWVHSEILLHPSNNQGEAVLVILSSQSDTGFFGCTMKPVCSSPPWAKKKFKKWLLWREE